MSVAPVYEAEVDIWAENRVSTSQLFAIKLDDTT